MESINREHAGNRFIAIQLPRAVAGNTPRQSATTTIVTSKLRRVNCICVKRDNVSVHRAAANKFNNENRATRGSACNALLSRDSAPRDQSRNARLHET